MLKRKEEKEAKGIHTLILFLDGFCSRLSTNRVVKFDAWTRAKPSLSSASSMSAGGGWIVSWCSCFMVASGRCGVGMLTLHDVIWTWTFRCGLTGELNAEDTFISVA